MNRFIWVLKLWVGFGCNHRKVPYENSTQTMNPDLKAAGILLPATSEPDGFLAEQAKGNLKFLEGGDSVRFSYSTGKITGNELQSLIKKIK